MGIETGVAIASLLVGVGTAAYQSDQARSAGNKAADRAKQAADQQEQQFNKVNGKRPDLAGMTSQEAMDARGGPSGTLLTGPSGVDPSQLLLGKSTLLGG